MLCNMEFKRKFSVNLFKSKGLSLAEMSFSSNFANDKRGDMYPLLSQGEERICGGHYFVSAGTKRFFCSLFPYATYEISFEALNGSCGFDFCTPQGSAVLCLLNTDGKLSLELDGEIRRTEYSFKEKMSFAVTMRKNNFEIYLNFGDMPLFIAEIEVPRLEGVHSEKLFQDSYVALICDGEAELRRVRSYMDCGLAQADIRPVKYENGEILTENGKVYFTLTARMHTEMYQAVFSWIPGSCELEYTGAIFFNTGDGYWCSDVATSLKFDRRSGKWLLWVCSFSHGHILGYCESDGDFRFGVNVADITLMAEADEGEDYKTFKGFYGDEDPDIIYDEKRGIWLFAVCRLVQSGDKRSYRYCIFEGSSPFKCDRFLASTEGGEETGGSFVPLDGEIYFVCGNGFKQRANYRVYTLPDMSAYKELEFDYDDGGFRGWGSIVPVKQGSRRRIYHLTFDRHNASEYNWSYGNLYCFEAYSKAVDIKRIK